MAAGDRTLPLLPLANIPIKEVATFLPSHPSAPLFGVSPCRQLFCALTPPGLDYTPPVWNSKGSQCYLQTGLGIYGGSGWPEAGSDMEKGSHDRLFSLRMPSIKMAGTIFWKGLKGSFTQRTGKITSKNLTATCLYINVLFYLIKASLWSYLICNYFLLLVHYWKVCFTCIFKSNSSVGRNTYIF